MGYAEDDRDYASDDAEEEATNPEDLPEADPAQVPEDGNDKAVKK